MSKLMRFKWRARNFLAKTIMGEKVSCFGFQTEICAGLMMSGVLASCCDESEYSDDAAIPPVPQ
eukprot:6892796-Alexandrium_andersonii.AAC.1